MQDSDSGELMEVMRGYKFSAKRAVELERSRRSNMGPKRGNNKPVQGSRAVAKAVVSVSKPSALPPPPVPSAPAKPPAEVKAPSEDKGEERKEVESSPAPAPTPGVEVMSIAEFASMHERRRKSLVKRRILVLGQTGLHVVPKSR